MKVNVGERIKYYRKLKNMTQAELAGDQITRNMLSLIENGTASPSLQTIEYIADRMGVSPACFFINSFDDINDHTKENNDNIRESFFNKEYQKCYDLIDMHYGNRACDLTDELILIAAEACMRIGISKVLKGAYESASNYLTLAHRYSSKSRYSTDWIESQVFLYEAVIENSDCPIQALDKDYSVKTRRSTEQELYNYRRP